MSVVASASSCHVGRPRLMCSTGFVDWMARWEPELTAAYGDHVHVSDYLEHWPGSARSFYTYRRAISS